MFTLLQAKVVETSTHVLLNYGAVGAMLVLCICALIFAVRLFVKQSDKTNIRMELMQAQINKYIEEDRAKMLAIITENTKAFQSLEKTMERLLDK